MDPMIEKMFNDNLLNFKIIVELVGYLRVKHGEEPSFTFACFKNGLDTEQTDDLLMFYSDITNEIVVEDIHLLDRNLLIDKTKEKIPNLTDDNKIGEIVDSYINCYFLLKSDQVRLQTQYQLVIKAMKKLHERLFQEHGLMERLE